MLVSLFINFNKVLPKDYDDLNSRDPVIFREGRSARADRTELRELGPAASFNPKPIESDVGKHNIIGLHAKEYKKVLP